MKLTLIYPGNKDDAAGLIEPLGLLYAASTIRSLGHDVKLLNASFPDELKKLESYVRDADMMLFSSTTQLFQRALQLIGMVRGIRPDVPVLIGGSHPTTMPKETIEAGFDYAIIGEGEAIIAAFLKEYENGRNFDAIDGFAYKDKATGEIKVNKRSHFIQNLDELPFPARDLWDYERYFRMGTDSIGIIATRGCPYNCSFCKPILNELFGNKWRARTAKNVADEMAFLAQNYSHLFPDGKLHIWFRDDTMSFCGVDWFRELKKEIEARNLDVHWGCHTRIDRFAPELAQAMKDAGMVQVSFGVESGSQKILNFYRKGIRIEQTLKTFETCHNLKLKTFAYFMVGAPEETKEDLEATYQLLKKINPDGFEVYTTTPAPGNDLFNYAQTEGIIKSNYDYWSNTFQMKMKYLTDRDLRAFKRKIMAYKNRKMIMNHLRSWHDTKRALKLFLHRPGYVYTYLRRSFALG